MTLFTWVIFSLLQADCQGPGWLSAAGNSVLLNGVYEVGVAERLLKAGADVNARNKYGETPVFTVDNPDVSALFVTHRAKRVGGCFGGSGSEIPRQATEIPQEGNGVLRGGSGAEFGPLSRDFFRLAGGNLCGDSGTASQAWGGHFGEECDGL